MLISVSAWSDRSVNHQILGLTQQGTAFKAMLDYRPAAKDVKLWDSKGTQGVHPFRGAQLLKYQ